MWRNPVGEGAKRVTTGRPSAVLMGVLALTRGFSKDRPGNDPKAREIGTAPSIAIRALQTARPRRLQAGWTRVEAVLEAERDHLPLWLPVGLGAGIAAWFWIPDRAGWLAFLAGAGAIGLLGLVLARGSRLGRAVMLFACAAAVGCGLVWAKADRLAAPRLDRPRVVALDGRVERIEPQPARDLTRLTLALAGPAAMRVRVNVVDDDLPAGLAIGDRIALRARLMPPSPPPLPGAYDFGRVAWFERIGATGRGFAPVTVVARGTPSPFFDRLADWRARLTAHIQSRIEGSAGGVATAFVTGDEGAITEEDAEAMRRSGLAHLLSISGLHVTAVVGATMLLALHLLALSPRLALHAPLPLIAAGCGALAALGYTLLSGAEVPTIRSCIAALLILGGLALGREAITLRLVAAGALIVLLFWPEAVAGPSFQMSFAAATAIVALHELPATRRLLQRREEALAARAGRALLGLVLTGLVVEAALAPIALFHFHKAGLYGAFANIVAIPLSTFVIMPLEALALFLDLFGIGAPAWWAAGQAVGLLLGIAHYVAQAPAAVAALPSMPRGAFALMIGGLLWLALWRTRLRLWGAPPFVAGAVWALLTPAPDVLITSDGKHLALRTPDGLALLRPRAGDYVRDTLNEIAGVEREAQPIEMLGDARCSRDFCLAVVDRGGRRWRILASRSNQYVAIPVLARACARADIVVSDRTLPACRPRWLKADRRLLAQTGGLAIDLDRIGILKVLTAGDDHPWRQPVIEGPGLSSGAAAPRAGPGSAPGPAGNAADRKRGSPDRGGPSFPRDGST
jgi:competence protein ComEC